MDDDNQPATASTPAQRNAEELLVRAVGERVKRRSARPASNAV